MPKCSEIRTLKWPLVFFLSLKKKRDIFFNMEDINVYKEFRGKNYEWLMSFWTLN